ncbi:MAG: hypothetical protein ABSB41_12750 [Anaerolineales bacterium]|jgi:hypothetical protein
MFAPLRRTFLNPSPKTRRWPWLLGLGALSLLIYWIGLIIPYNLFTLQLKPLLDIAKLSVHKPLAQVGFVLILASQSGLYFLAWCLCRPMGMRQPRAMWLVLSVSLGLLALSMLWLYPIGAADVFDYIMRGRITAIYGGNPFVLTPRYFPLDPFRHYVGWVDTTSTYGPLWELMAAAISRLAGNGILANVLGFKLLALIFYSGSTALVALILNRVAPERALQGVVLFAWNPLTLYDSLGNAHNDIVMIFFILLGVYAILRGHFSWTMLALTAGALVKIVPVILLPLAWTAGLGALSGVRQRLRFTFLTGVACAGLALVLFVPFLKGWNQLVLMPTLDNLFTTSLPAFIEAQLQRRIGVRLSHLIVGWAAYAAVGVVILYQMRRIWLGTSPGEKTAKGQHPGQVDTPTRGLVFIRAATFTLLFYLIFACAWFQAWYALWPLALAALLPIGPITWTAMLLSYVSLWKTPIFNFFLFTSSRYLPPAIWRETLLGPITLGLVWLYLAARAATHWTSRPSLRHTSIR